MPGGWLAPGCSSQSIFSCLGSRLSPLAALSSCFCFFCCSSDIHTVLSPHSSSAPRLLGNAGTRNTANVMSHICSCVVLTKFSRVVVVPTTPRRCPKIARAA